MQDLQRIETHYDLNYPTTAKSEWEAKGRAIQRGLHPSHGLFWGVEEEYRHHQPRLKAVEAAVCRIGLICPVKEGAYDHRK